MTATRLFSVCLLYLALPLTAQFVSLRPVPRNVLPDIIDGNTAAYWHDGILTAFHSSGIPTLSRGLNQFELGAAIPIDFQSPSHKPVWFEAVWRDQDGTLFLWYHYEPPNVCDGLTSPKIGAAVSHDNGLTVQDLGIILEAIDVPNCAAQNGFFASGHGDMSAVLDDKSGYFYFFFTNYGGDPSGQGIVSARMAFNDRLAPLGKVHKFHKGLWEEPGIRGLVTPIFSARRGWQYKDADSYWGPSVHYNTHLNHWVMLLNHACCDTGWPQFGIAVSFNQDLVAAGSWQQPRQILDGRQLPERPGFYPQVLGLEAGGTDTLAGRTSRLYIHGIGDYEIVFDPEVPLEEGPVDDSLNPASSAKPVRKKPG